MPSERLEPRPDESIVRERRGQRHCSRIKRADWHCVVTAPLGWRDPLPRSAGGSDRVGGSEPADPVPECTSEVKAVSPQGYAWKVLDCPCYGAMELLKELMHTSKAGSIVTRERTAVRRQRRVTASAAQQTRSRRPFLRVLAATCRTMHGARAPTSCHPTGVCVYVGGAEGGVWCV